MLLKELLEARKNPNPWVIVENPGEDNEDIVIDFPTHGEAKKWLSKNRGKYDIMKRLDNGKLTTEF